MTDKMKSFVKGILAGLAGKLLEFAPGKEPVAYLYNGVRLPKLPEWDKTAYPYAFIYYYGATDNYHLVLSPGRCVYDAVFKWIDLPNDGGVRWTATDGAWEYVQSDVSQVPMNTANETYAVWCNEDILHSDGTVYLAASDPIPVYE